MTTSTALNLPVVQVEIVNGKPAVTSLQVAEAFGVVLDKGKQELVKLYQDGKLTMKKGEKPCAHRA